MEDDEMESNESNDPDDSDSDDEDEQEIGDQTILIRHSNISERVQKKITLKKLLE